MMHLYEFAWKTIIFRPHLMVIGIVHYCTSAGKHTYELQFGLHALYGRVTIENM